MYYAEDFDPEQIFNMFFGGMGVNPGMRGGGFRAHHGGGGFSRARQQQQQQQQQQHHQAQDRSPAQAALMGFMQFLPVILLLFFSFFSASTPSYSLSKTSYYVDTMRTQRLDLPFFVKSRYEFERSHPRSSTTRLQVDRMASL